MKIILSFLLLPVMAMAENATNFAARDIAAVTKKGFTNESGLGYVVTGGNSQSQTVSLNQKSIYAWDRDTLQFTGHYIQNEGLDQNTGLVNQTAENWSATLRFERRITKEKFKAFLAYGWYGDRFQGVREASATDIGAKYYWKKTDTVSLHSELGYRYTRELLTQEPTEKVGVGNSIMPEYHYIRLYNEIKYEYSKTLSLGFWIEYLPSITTFAEDQRINYSPYLTSTLTDIFSLKVSYESRYRFKPAVAGNKLVDFTFNTSLIAKF